MKATIIREPYISLILDGHKTWEMRSSRALHRGLVALIKKGTGHVVGTAQLVDSRPPLTTRNYAEHEHLHRVAPADQPAAIRSKWVYPWVLSDIRKLQRPVPYIHKGGVTWVNLDEEVSKRVLEQIGEHGKTS